MKEKEAWEKARERYESAEIPEELSGVVSAALREGTRRQASRRAVRRGWGAALAACACFCLLVNVNPAFASAVAEVPVLGSLAQIFTAERYQRQDRDHLIDVRLPALADTGNTDLEQRINLEIKKRIDDVLAEAEERARETREAYVETGGTEEEFIPIIIDVDYEVKCSDGQYLSFLIWKTETLASAYTELYAYNLDLAVGKELTLRDILGPDFQGRADAVIRSEMDRREREEGAVYFWADRDGDGFQGIGADQKFYLNDRGEPVVLFEKYEIAPGSMGIQEFTIPLSQ